MCNMLENDWNTTLIKMKAGPQGLAASNVTFPPSCISAIFVISSPGSVVQSNTLLISFIVCSPHIVSHCIYDMQ